MQPPRLSNQHPNYDAFSQHLNALIKQKCQETGYSYLINHQLRLHFQKAPVLPDGNPLDLKRLNAIPIDRSLALLPLVRRIRIAVDLMGGIDRVAQALHQDRYSSPLPLLTPQEIRQAAGLANSVRELTDRVVTIYELDSFRVLRTFLFNSIGKCLQKDKVLSTRVNYPGLENQTMKAIITHSRSLLLHMFANLGSLNDSKQFPEAVKLIAKVKEYLSSFPEYREGKKGDLQQVYKEIDNIRLCLQIFEIALSKPLIYLPQMLVRVCVLPVNGSSELDKEWASPFATDWINDAVTGWETQIESFFARTKDIEDSALQKQASQLQGSSEALLNEARNGINPDVSLSLKSIQEFAKLSLELKKDWLDSVEKPLQDLSQRIQQFHDHYQRFKEGIDKLVLDCRGTLHPVQTAVEADQPIYVYYKMVASIVETIETRHRFYRQFYKTIEEVIKPSSFKSLPHISLLDLVQLQMRALLPSDKGLFHIKFEGLLALIREELAGCLIDDDTKIQAAFQADRLQSELGADLKPYDEVISLLKHYFLMKDGQHLFAVNPFALDKHQTDLEQQYYFELYASCRKVLLSFQSEALLQLKADGPHSTAVQRLINDFGKLSKIQDVLRGQDATRANYQDLARDLIARMTQFARGIEDRTEELQLLISLDQSKEDSPALRKLSANLDHLYSSLQSLFFLPAQPLISHLLCEELKHEEKVKTVQKSRKHIRQACKQKPAPMKSALPASVAEKKQPEKPLAEPASSLWTSFFERNQELIQTLAKRELKEDQKACVRNLEGNLNLIQDLVRTVKSHGARPYFILEANTALMVHLEQTIALLNNSQASLDESDQFVYRERGLEPDQHAPHLQLKQATDPAHLAFMEKRKRVIAISSRYLGLEQDRLTENVKQTLTLSDPRLADAYRKATQNDLNSGMNAFLDILKNQKWAPVFFDEKSISHEELDRILAARQTPAMDWKSTADSCLHRLESNLTRIQQYRMVTFHREVPCDELNSAQRKGTIRLALADLEMTARLSRDLLQEDWDASQGLILSKQAWLRQSVALERVLLLFLSHLPAKEGEDHFLWTESGPKLKRYSHDLLAYTKKLRQLLKGEVADELLNETQELAIDLEPYLKVLYRYHASPPCPAKARLDKIDGLMRLRKQLLGNLSGWKENQKDHLDKLLGATQPGERLTLLDAHIRNTIRHDAMLPLLDTLDLVEEWLQVYKNLLFAK